MLAPLPVWLESVDQAWKRTTLVVRVGVREGAAGHEVRIIAERDGRRPPFEATAVDVSAPGVIEANIELQEPVERGDVVVALVLDGVAVQTARCEIQRTREKNCRREAISFMDARSSRLKRDLGVDMPGVSFPGSFAFETAVGHLLTLLGFSCVGWGPQVEQKKKGKQRGQRYLSASGRSWLGT